MLSYVLQFIHSYLLDGTTANTLAFALWELAKDLELQRRVREEVVQILNDRTEIEFSEYEGMHVLVAFIKVCSQYQILSPETILT